MIEKYYEEELRYLYDSGKEFARAHPDIAHFLNIDSVGDRDPYVERLFEGFAFLTGRIKEKIDDTFPELSEGLLNLMWPGFLHEIPSTAIVQFTPRTGLLQETRILRNGAELLSEPAGPEKTICRFTTTHDMAMHPVSLQKIDRSIDTKNRETLTFHFTIAQGVTWERLKLNPLRIFFHAEIPTALVLHRFFTRQVIGSSIAIDNGRKTWSIEPQEAVTAAGFKKEESLLPHDSRSFWGHMMLLEFFMYPEKFLFVDLHGFDKIPTDTDPSPKSISYSLTFDSDFPINRPFSKENFRMHCVPAVNIFKKETEPIVYTGKQSQYKVTADSGFPNSVHAHSIRSVIGIDRATGERYTYKPFYNFDTLGKKNTRTYSASYRRSPDGKRTMYLSVGGAQLTNDELREESLSINAFCTNGVIPREEITEGGICKPGNGFPDYAMFKNITRPTLPSPPPLKDDYIWIFLSHLGTTFTTLSSSDSLRSFLHLYNWSNAEGRKRRIDSISDVSSRPIEKVVCGSVLRGIEFSISVLESEFQDIGDLHLFGAILKEFLANYVTINSFLKLKIVLRPSGESLSWDSLEGKRWLI